MKDNLSFEEEIVLSERWVFYNVLQRRSFLGSSRLSTDFTLSRQYVQSIDGSSGILVLKRRW